jgi:membrane fusion protein, multidrug efflux system
MNQHRARRLLSAASLYVVGLGGLAAAFLFVAAAYTHRASGLQHESEARAYELKQGPLLNIVSVGESSDTRSITYLGETKPFQTVTLYSKISGYVRKINVDKGDTVSANQIIAVIDSPETEHQLRSADATLENTRTNLKRAQQLAQLKFISPQAVEQQKMEARVAEANRAGVASQKDYEVVRAPFAGTVTTRFVDVGALVQNATSNQTSALPIVTVSQTNKLRVSFYVEQQHSSLVHVGGAAEIVDPAHPERVIQAKVARASGELDPKTRTLLTELDLDNADAALLPGSFVQVSLKTKTQKYAEIPAAALVTRGSKTFVAVVQKDDTIRFKPVTVAEHDGQLVRLRDGVVSGERIALNAGDAVAEGGKIRILPPAQNK